MPDPPKRILLVGESLYLTAIASVLCQQPGIQLVRADEAAPDAILTSTHGDWAILALVEQYAGTPILALDEATHTLIMLEGARAPANTTQDLVRAIQKWVAR